MDGFELTTVPAVRAPVVVVAFNGWSDTGTVTTDVANHLVEVFGGERFLSVDPESYFQFTEARPTVKLDEQGIRQIEWPKVEAFSVRMAGGPHDLVVIAGVEPNFRWRTFSERLSELVAGFEPALVCTLVARPAATPHTRPIPVSGSSADAALCARYGLGRSAYQGPTGIVGVVHDSLRRRGALLISLAASVPHYLNVEENPPAAIALLKALEPFIGVAVPLAGLEGERERFLERVDEASRGDEQIVAYVKTLEEHYSEAGVTPAQPEGELPSAADILRDVEDLLRGGDSS